MSKPSDMIQGTLDFLILKTLSLEPKHGWAIAKRIEQVSEDVLQVTQGALYPALHRREQQSGHPSDCGASVTPRDALSQLPHQGGTGCSSKRGWGNWMRFSNAAVGLIIRHGLTELRFSRLAEETGIAAADQRRSTRISCCSFQLRSSAFIGG